VEDAAGLDADGYEETDAGGDPGADSGGDPGTDAGADAQAPRSSPGWASTKLGTIGDGHQ